MGRAGAIGLLLALLPAVVAHAEAIVVQSTTSTQNSGLYDVLVPKVAEATGVEMRVVAVGTGQAIENARRCDGDLLIVHAKPAEEAFVEAGYGVERTDLMYNDFVIIGPDDDPADIGGMGDAAEALGRIAQTESLFASRGDDSGTHKAELALWAGTDADPAAASGTWYRETGSGMGATLNAAVGMGAYALTDRATWVAFANKQDARVLVEGDPALFNQYGVIPVSPEACPNVNAAGARAVADWLTGAEGQAAIAAFRVEGEQLFTPNAP